jgi:WD40 repeat protein
MSHRLALLAALMCAAAAAFAQTPGDDDSDPDPKVLARLVDDLGSDDFRFREEAMVELRKIGEPAIPFLRRHHESADAEMRRRVLDLLADIEKKGQRFCFTGHVKPVMTVALLPGDQRALSAGEDRTIRLWDLNDGKQLRQFEGHDKHVWALAVRPDGKSFASSGQDADIRLWSLNGQPRSRLLASLPASVRCLQFSADGKRLFAGAFDKNIYVIEVDSGKIAATWTGHTDAVLCLAVSPDGRSVLTGGGFLDASVCLRDAGTGAIRHRLVGHREYVNAVAFIDNERGASAGQDRIIRLWNLKTGKIERTLKAHEQGIHALAVSRDGRRLLSGGYDRRICLWDTDTGDELRRYPLHDDGVNALAITANGRYAVSAANDQTVRMWYLPRVRKKT